VLTLASAKERSTGPKADAPGPWRRHGGPGRRGREDDSVPPLVRRGTAAPRWRGPPGCSTAQH
jgi:hypothetical protein